MVSDRQVGLTKAPQCRISLWHNIQHWYIGVGNKSLYNQFAEIVFCTNYIDHGLVDYVLGSINNTDYENLEGVPCR